MPQGDAVQEVKDRLDIVEVISGYVRLQRAGRDYKGLCPFHSEKTPSFTVSAEKQVWYCFGCQKGGTVFDFVMNAEQVEFAQALEMLAERAGVELEDHRGRRRGPDRQKAREVNQLAAQYFQHILLNLPAGGRGLRYLEKRGVEPEAIAAFGVGYAPAGRSGDNLLRFLRSKGITDDQAVKAGVALGGEGRRPIDRFRGRLMFPLSDESGTVVGFSGRAMDSTPPKYMNSPQTSIYDKGRTIFGLSHARKSIAAQDRALLVEGQFDVMMAHQYGIDIAVASSGTAITPDQLKMLRRHATNLLLCLDADEAGREATKRTIEMAARAGLRATVVELPNAKDPGEFFRKTPQLWSEAEGAAVAGWEWWIGGVLDAHNLRTPDGRAAAATTVVGVLNRIPEEATLDIYCQFAAERLQIDPARLLADVQNYRRTGSVRRASQVTAGGAWATVASATTGLGSIGIAADNQPEEDRLLALLIVEPQAGAFLGELTAEEPLASAELQDLCRRIVEVVQAEGGGNLERRLDLFAAEERPRLARLSLTSGFIGEEQELKAAVADCVDRIRLKTYESKMALVEDRLRELATGEADSAREDLLQEHRRLAERRAALKGHLFQGRS